MRRASSGLSFRFQLIPSARSSGENPPGPACVCTCMHMRAHACTCVHMRAHACACGACVYMCACVCVLCGACVCMHACIMCEYMLHVLRHSQSPAYMHVRPYRHTCTHMHTHTCTHMHIRTYQSMYRAGVHTRAYTHTCIRMRIHTHMHTHAYTHTEHGHTHIRIHTYRAWGTCHPEQTWRT